MSHDYDDGDKDNDGNAIEMQDRLIVISMPQRELNPTMPMPGWASMITDALTGELIPTVTNCKIVIESDATEYVRARLRMFKNEAGRPVYAGDAMVVGENGDVLQGDFWFWVAGMIERDPVRRHLGRRPVSQFEKYVQSGLITVPDDEVIPQELLNAAQAHGPLNSDTVRELADLPPLQPTEDTGKACVHADGTEGPDEDRIPEETSS